MIIDTVILHYCDKTPYVEKDGKRVVYGGPHKFDIYLDKIGILRIVPQKPLKHDMIFVSKIVEQRVLNGELRYFVRFGRGTAMSPLKFWALFWSSII